MTIPLVSIGIAFLMAGLSLPMIFRRVPMNGFYGARFKASFQSEENWYEINAYGGKVFLAASLPVALCGILGLFLDGKSGWYVWLIIAVMLLSTITAAFLSYLKALRVGKRRREN